MKRSIKQLACPFAVLIFAVLIPNNAMSGNVNINFEDSPLIWVHGVTNISSQGFTFTSNDDEGLGTLFNGNPCGPDCGANGTQTLTVSGWGAGIGSGGPDTQPVMLTNDDDMPFRLLSLDVAELTSTLQYNASEIEITGYVLGGGTISTVITLDGIIDGPGGVEDFETFILNDTWQNTYLTSVSFRDKDTYFFDIGAFSLDNLIVDGDFPGNIDTDGDGVLDDEDACPFSDLNDTVAIDDCDSGVENVLRGDGCTILDLISQCADYSNNHGEFVSCVSYTTNNLKKGRMINGNEKGKIQSCAAEAGVP